VANKRSDNDFIFNDNEHHEETINRLQHYEIKATGTSASIVLFGIKERLDKEQQMAFEIVVATFVLGFFESDAITTSTEQMVVDLKCLARKTKNPNRPMVLFITGPAGAGKCM